MLSEQRKKVGRARPTCLHTHIHMHTFSRGTFPRSCENLIKGDLTLLGGCVRESVCACGRVWESQGICKGQHKRWDDWKRDREREREMERATSEGSLGLAQLEENKFEKDGESHRGRWRYEKDFLECGHSMRVVSVDTAASATAF